MHNKACLISVLNDGTVAQGRPRLLHEQEGVKVLTFCAWSKKRSFFSFLTYTELFGGKGERRGRMPDSPYLATGRLAASEEMCERIFGD